MKILVIGAGSIGGYYGGRLARSGHSVYFIARGKHLKAIQESGLTVESVTGDFTVKPPASNRFERLEELDLILVCVKHGDTQSILPIIHEQAGNHTIVMSLQNGVDKDTVLARVVSRENIIGGIAFIGSALISPGRVKHTAAGKITIGELNGCRTERVAALKEAFEVAGIPCSITTDVVKAEWEKLLWNVGFNGICALTGLTVHQVLDYPPTRTVIHGLMEEHIEVARRRGIVIDPALADKYIENSRKGGDLTPSTLQDLKHGRPTEIGIMNGKIFRDGKDLEFPTPYNECVWSAVSAIDVNRATPM